MKKEETDKKLFAHDILQATKKFMTTTGENFYVNLSCTNPTMLMTEDGKEFTGRVVQVFINVDNEEDDFSDEEL